MAVVLLAGDEREGAFAVQTNAVAPAVEVGAKAAFYDPLERRPLPPRETGGMGLRPVTVIRPFPSFGAVGIHYWFLDGLGHAMTASRALDANVATVRLHVRSNTGGFLSLWIMGSDSATELTPRDDQYGGHRVSAGSVFVVPRDFAFTAGAVERIIVIFSRSQTEQAGTAANVIPRLEFFRTLRDQAGAPVLATETDHATAGEIGTYVVNQRGGPVAAEILLGRSNSPVVSR